jgi:hypothetical protein
MRLAAGVIILGILDMHMPFGLAVALLPFVMPIPNFRYPVSVDIGTFLLTGAFHLYQRTRDASDER